ncbi:hypothetical protein PPL_10189 [Heterostelium album PN500]|uniref:Uncharacterized protein n=1 Tax=Heterostelium pallidum (strain ATCC 26659 / Pp 5 / PN500) TaxID=670386 RepID=D3BQK4_HETP5|nr:hypothetical protein PPL_10189 [Heterostelium album PN500]EFA76424.1 hypothetical protein PPL_10189 [Heterostelium album PN500]|eukprot:XP_020428556.1 hypothetical protein PPL_10189 [Heterostelium album PN500]
MLINCLSNLISQSSTGSLSVSRVSHSSGSILSQSANQTTIYPEKDKLVANGNVSNARIFPIN